MDSGGGYNCVPVTHSGGGGGLGHEHLDSQLYGHIFLPGHQRPRRPKLQHSQSILRKQAEEEAIKRSRSLSESYELSSDLQDKQVGRQHVLFRTVVFFVLHTISALSTLQKKTLKTSNI